MYSVALKALLEMLITRLNCGRQDGGNHARVTLGKKIEIIKGAVQWMLKEKST